MNSNGSSRVGLIALAAAAGLAAAAPPNDLCADAIALIPGGANVSGSTVGAGSVGPDGSVCAPLGADVWYRYQHPTGAYKNLTVSLCNPGTSFDTVLAVYSGACNQLQQVACSDDFCGTQSSVTFTVQPGQTYFIRVAGYGTTPESGTFEMSSSLTDFAPPDPDVIVGDITEGSYWGKVGTTRSMSFGTTSCNIGTSDALWISSTNEHPVIGQNLYRIENGRFEQIGMSWLKHGFLALTENLCATCNGHGGSVLGVGCSDPYVSSLNGNQTLLGPRSHINATNGYYPYPFENNGSYQLPVGYMNPPPPATTIGRRLQVAEADMFHAGATYVAECQYVTADDARANHGTNNMSYRISSFQPLIVPTTFSLQNSTVRQQPAIMAWHATDAAATVTPYTYDDNGIICKVWVGVKVVANANSTWTYNYAVFNGNCDRSFGSFELPSRRTTATNPYQRLPLYHSGEAATMNAAWAYAASTAGISWTVPQTFAVNPNSSALRWATTATFCVTTNTPPTTGTAHLGFFKTSGSLDLTGLTVPSSVAPTCAADFNDDGALDFFDYLDFVQAFSAGSASADFNSDSVVDFFDYLDFVQAFAAGC